MQPRWDSYRRIIMVIYRCEDSIESVFTAIYNSYEEKRKVEDTVLSLDDEPVLFAEEVAVIPDLVKVRKVMNTLQKRFGEEDYYSICLALAAPDVDKATAVYRTVCHGLNRKVRPGHLFDSLADSDVMRCFALAKCSGREIHHLEGFIRLRELESGILYGVFGPKCNAMTFLMPHFADRFDPENFILYDENRGIYGVHPAGGQWYLRNDRVEDSNFTYSDKEKEYGVLFRDFTRTIAIESRRNEKLQRNMLPLRFRDYMIEFQ